MKVSAPKLSKQVLDCKPTFGAPVTTNEKLVLFLPFLAVAFAVAPVTLWGAAAIIALGFHKIVAGQIADDYLDELEDVEEDGDE